jgi:hypothetical protein
MNTDIKAKVQEFLSTATIEEMRELNHEVVDAIKSKVRERDRISAAQFKIGDKVWFDARTHGIKHGEIVAFNVRTAKVRVLNINQKIVAGLPQIWTVAFVYLNKEV